MAADSYGLRGPMPGPAPSRQPNREPGPEREPDGISGRRVVTRALALRRLIDRAAVGLLPPHRHRKTHAVLGRIAGRRGAARPFEAEARVRAETAAPSRKEPCRSASSIPPDTWHESGFEIYSLLF